MDVTRWLTTTECNLRASLSNIRVLQGKESASNSVILFGLVAPRASEKRWGASGENVILKVTWAAWDPLWNSLKVELAIYQNVITSLVNNRHTPNLIAYLGYPPCNGVTLAQFETGWKGVTKGEFEDEMNKIDDDEFQKDAGFRVLVLEKSGGITMNYWIGRDGASRTLREVLAVFFQLFYTLLCFTHIGLRHNDLHYGNIFIEDMGREVTLYFARGPDSYVELKTRWIPKIYDWDRGSILHPAVPRNLDLDMNYCQDYGQCADWNPKADAYQVLAIYVFKFAQYLLPEVSAQLNASWVWKIMREAWYEANMVRQWGYILKVHATDAQFKPVPEALSMLLNVNWTDKPFEVKTGDLKVLPPELLFTPPKPRKVETTMWKPDSAETHPALGSNPTFPAFSPWFAIIRRITPWIKESEQQGWDPLSSMTQFEQRLIAAKPSLKMNEWYKTALYVLLLPQFHQLSRPQQEAILDDSPALIGAMDDIWNVFANRLPIEIPKYQMVDA